MTERVRTFTHLRHGDSVPNHAEVVSTFNGAHHGRHGVLLELFAEDTGFEGCAIDTLYGDSIESLRNPFPWPPARKVYIDAVMEPGLRAAPPIGTGKTGKAVPRLHRAAVDIPTVR